MLILLTEVQVLDLCSVEIGITLLTRRIRLIES